MRLSVDPKSGEIQRMLPRIGERVEKPLLDMARKLMAYDEASLTTLWEKYAAIVENFEPTKRWEEAVVALGLIQTIRWKNQLFNYHWLEQESDPAKRGVPPTMPADAASILHHSLEKATDKAEEGPSDAEKKAKSAKVLQFRPKVEEEHTPEDKD
jgi:hypothetical protein